MKNRVALSLAAGLLASIGVFAVPALATGGGGDHKVVICHKDHHTIVVDRHAVRAHLRHGDYLGRCNPQSPPPPTETEEPTPDPTQPTEDPTTPPPTEEPTPDPTTPVPTEPVPTPTETETTKAPAPVVPDKPVGPKGAGTKGTLSSELPVTGPTDTLWVAGGLATLLGALMVAGTALFNRRRKFNLS